MKGDEEMFRPSHLVKRIRESGFLSPQRRRHSYRQRRRLAVEALEDRCLLSGLSGLEYSTYFSPDLGSWDDIGWDVAVDGSGNAYVVGETAVCDYCGPPFPPPFSPGDVFVAKFDASGALAWSTKLPGSGDDAGYGVAVDSSGDVYITGQTGSSDFPTTAGAFQAALSGSQDAFVTKLDGGNGALLYSSYLGGGGSELPWSLALDSAGNVYVTGTTDSADFPTTAGAFQTALSGASDAFVVQLNLNTANPSDQLVYASYLGGSGDDTGVEIVVDAAGKVYVAGETTSPLDFPTQNAFQANYGGGSYDGFLTRLDPAGSGLEYSTYLGGSGYDGGWGVVVDAFGNAFMTGPTDSADFPTTSGAFQQTFGGVQDAYVTKIDTTQAGAASAIYSTYLGGSDSEDGNEIALLGNEVLVVGNTRSADFPTQNAFQASLNVWYDAFVTRFNASGSAVVDSTYLGGSKVDWAWGIALDGAGDVYITGETHSETDFPTQNAHQPTFGGGKGDAFLTKFTGTGAPPPPPPPPASTTKFFIVDSDVDDAFEYDDAGALLENTNLAPGNVDPVGTTASADGSTVWVVDKNKTVYVYDGDGNEQGSWTAGGLNRAGGIATDETDIWIVDEKNKRVYRYNAAAGLTSGNQNPNAKPGGITIDPSGSSQSIWIVDRGNGEVFEYANARGNSGGSLSGSFSLASGNTKPEGIADPLASFADQLPLASVPEGSRRASSNRFGLETLDNLPFGVLAQNSPTDGKDHYPLRAGFAFHHDDLAALDAAMSDWATGDLASALDNLGGITDDLVRDALKGAKGVDKLVGGVGDKLRV